MTSANENYRNIFSTSNNKNSVFNNIFSVFDNTTAKIAVKGNYDDYENTYDIIEKSTVTGDLQPYSGDMASKDYGLQIDCQYVFYCPRNSDITVGAYLITDTKTYEVTYVADWNMGLQLMLKGVKLNGRRK